MTRRTGGFTIVEILVVAVLGSFLMMVILQTLITNQRTYTAQSARIQGQQAMRAAAEVLFNEIREISPQGGDLVQMGSTGFKIRSMRKFGLVCELDPTSPPTLRVLQVGDWFEAGDSVFVFADNQTKVGGDDTWIAARVTAVDKTVTCGPSPAQDLFFSGQGPLFAADIVYTGAAVRSYVHHTYGLISYAGESYLGRLNADLTTVPMVGPLAKSSGLGFVYLDSLGATTSIRADVRQVQVTIRTASTVRNSLGEMVSDSISALIFTRN